MILLIFIALSTSLIGLAQKPPPDEQTYILNRIKLHTDSIINSIFNDLDLAATQFSVNADSNSVSAKFISILTKYKDLVDIKYITAQGAIKYIEPEKYHNLVKADLSSTEQITKIMRSDKPLVSRFFTAPEEFDAIEFLAPIIKSNVFGGCVSVILKPDIFFDNILEKLGDKSDYDITMFDNTGKVFYSTKHSLIGKSLLYDSRYNIESDYKNAINGAINSLTGKKAYKFKGNDYTIWWVSTKHGGVWWKIGIMKEN